MYRETLKVHMCTWHGHRRGFKKRNIVMALLVRRLAWNKKKHGTIRNKNSYSYGESVGLFLNSIKGCSLKWAHMGWACGPNVG